MGPDNCGGTFNLGKDNAVSSITGSMVVDNNGADELIFNAQFSPDIDSTEDLLSRMEQLRMMAR